MKNKILIIGIIIIIVGAIFAFFFIKYQKQACAWNLAKKENTVVAFQKYMDAYKEGKYLATAKELQEEAFWKDVLKENTPPAYDKYLSFYSNGKYIKEAENNFKKLGAYEINFKSQTGALTIDRILIDFNSTTIYFKDNNILKHTRNIDLKNAYLQDSVKTYKVISAKYNLEDYKDNSWLDGTGLYIAIFEKIPYYVKKIDIRGGSNCFGGCVNFDNFELDRKEIVHNEEYIKKEDAYWNQTLSENTAQGYNKYLMEYPYGKYVKVLDFVSDDGSVKGTIIYVGELLNGIRQGKGVGIFKLDNTGWNGKYIGEWENGKQNGKGEMVWDNGIKYTGEFKNGKFDGNGSWICPDRRSYVGEFKNHSFNGQGTFTWANGDIYEGGWKDGVKHGKCKYFRAWEKIWYHGSLNQGNGELHDELGRSITFQQ